jgi:hypothetical protein
MQSQISSKFSHTQSKFKLNLKKTFYDSRLGAEAQRPAAVSRGLAPSGGRVGLASGARLGLASVPVPTRLRRGGASTTGGCGGCRPTRQWAASGSGAARMEAGGGSVVLFS